MSEEITGVCVDIPTMLLRAKNERICNNLIQMLHALPPEPVTYRLVTFNNWISVADRLPEEGKDVLCAGSGGSQYVTSWVSDDKWVDRECSYHKKVFLTCVTHWQPLPELPKK